MLIHPIDDVDLERVVRLLTKLNSNVLTKRMSTEVREIRSKN